MMPATLPADLAAARASTTGRERASGYRDEQSILGDHLALCGRANRGVFALRCAVESMHGFASGRLVTMVMLIGLVIAGALLVV